jgi:hypothetical protein
MQAIARANRVYPGKDCGVIVDYNGMLKSLREALAQYALGDGDDADPGEVVAPIQTCPSPQRDVRCEGFLGADYIVRVRFWSGVVGAAGLSAGRGSTSLCDARLCCPLAES